MRSKKCHSFNARFNPPCKPGFLSSERILSIRICFPLNIDSTRRLRRCWWPLKWMGWDMLERRRKWCTLTWYTRSAYYFDSYRDHCTEIPLELNGCWIYFVCRLAWQILSHRSGLEHSGSSNGSGIPSWRWGTWFLSVLVFQFHPHLRLGKKLFAKSSQNLGYRRWRSGLRDLGQFGAYRLQGHSRNWYGYNRHQQSQPAVFIQVGFYFIGSSQTMFLIMYST